MNTNYTELVTLANARAWQASENRFDYARELLKGRGTDADVYDLEDALEAVLEGVFI